MSTDGGLVYILENEAMPGLVKIGFTRRTVGVRAEELHSVGVPMPFRIVFAIWSPCPESLEKAVHERLDYLRVCENREFFKTVAENAVFHLIDESFSFNHLKIKVVREWAFIEPELLEDYAVAKGIHPVDIAEYVMECMRSGIGTEQCYQCALSEDIEPPNSEEENEFVSST